MLRVGMLQIASGKTVALKNGDMVHIGQFSFRVSLLTSPPDPTAGTITTATTVTHSPFSAPMAASPSVVPVMTPPTLKRSASSTIGSIAPKSKRSRDGIASSLRVSTASASAARVPSVRMRSLQMGLVIEGRWTIRSFVGEGTFSHIYAADDAVLRHAVAIKFQKLGIRRNLLEPERAVMEMLKDSPYVARVFSWGSFMLPDHVSTPTVAAPSPTSSSPLDRRKLHYVVMQLLGENVSSFRKRHPDGKVPVSTARVLALSMLRALQSVHQHGWVHRDVKAANFALPLESVLSARSSGAPGDDSTSIPPPEHCYVLDFGLARQHMTNGVVGPQREVAEFRGTSAYVSLSVHEEHDQGRVDDLWSWFFILIELLGGTLKWKDPSLSREQVYYMKRAFLDGDELLRAYPTACVQMAAYLHTLRFADEPDYDRLASLLASMKSVTGAAASTVAAVPTVAAVTTVQAEDQPPSEPVNEWDALDAHAAPAAIVTDDLHSILQDVKALVNLIAVLPETPVAVSRDCRSQFDLLQQRAQANRVDAHLFGDLQAFATALAAKLSAPTPGPPAPVASQVRAVL